MHTTYLQHLSTIFCHLKHLHNMYIMIYIIKSPSMTLWVSQCDLIYEENPYHAIVLCPCSLKTKPFGQTTTLSLVQLSQTRLLSFQKSSIPDLVWYEWSMVLEIWVGCKCLLYLYQNEKSCSLRQRYNRWWKEQINCGTVCTMLMILIEDKRGRGEHF